MLFRSKDTLKQGQMVKMDLLELVQSVLVVLHCRVDLVQLQVVVVEMVVIGDRMVEKHQDKDLRDLQEQQLPEILHFLLILINYMELSMEIP